MKTLGFIKYFLLLTLWIVTFHAHSQIWKNIDANWVFPQNYQMNFTGAFPDTLSETQLDSTVYMNVSVSDYNGSLLFYSDGINVWNANNLIMPWSQASSPGGTLNHIFSMQKNPCVNALHVPLNMNKYYLFTFNYSSNLTELNSYYSEINMNYGMGFGDINPLKKNMLFENNVIGDLYIVNHQNGYDQWVILHKSGTDTVLSYLLTEYGFTDLVISKTGPIINTNMLPSNFTCFELCKSSPNGEFLLLHQYLASIVSSNNLYSFDDSTGRVIHIMNLDSLTTNNVGNFEFSPNSQYLYSGGQIFGPPLKIDISSGIPSQILSSILMLPIPIGTRHWNYRTAIDGKMYFRGSYDVYTANPKHGIGRFESPDAPGMNIGIQDTIFSLSRPSGWFPKKAVGWYWNIAGFEYQGICLGDTTFFQTHRPEIYLDSVKYDFGDPASGILNLSQEYNPAHYYSQPGVYEVEIITYRMNIPDTAVVSIEIFENPISELPTDTSFCAGSEITLSAGPSAADYIYLWDNHPGSSTYNILTLEAQYVYLSIIDTITTCSTKDSILLMPYPLNAEFVIAPAFCPNQELEIIYTGNADSTANYYWDFSGAIHLSGSGQGPHLISYPNDGIYETSLHIIQGQCFSDTLVFAVQVPQYHSIESEIGHPSCFGFNDGIIQIDTLNILTSYTYLWNNGETGSTISNLQYGWYFLTISYLADCQVADSFLLLQPNPIEVFSIISDVSATGSSDGSIQVYVSGGTPTYTYLWNTGATASFLENLAAGNYFLTISDSQACEWDSGFVVQDYVSAPWNDTKDQIKVYPNPGNEVIIIECKEQTFNAVFSLFDLNGRLLLEEKITEPFSSVNTSSLSTGSYTWLIKKGDEIMAKGIWVKK